MTLEEFKSKARGLAISYLNNVNTMIEDEKTEPELKQRLIATAQSLTLYIEDDLESLQNGSENSISKD